MVTEQAVYHWNIYDPAQAAPTRIHDRNQNLSVSYSWSNYTQNSVSNHPQGAQIINYRVNEDDKWSVTIGISQQAGRVIGQMQLHSRERGISQAIEGHAAAFGSIHMDGAPTDTRLFTFAVRSSNGQGKLHIVEIDHQQSNPQFPKKAVDIYFPPEAQNDFPVAMQVAQKYSVIYMVTKYGFIHLYDLYTGACLFMNRISSETIFTTVGDADSSGIIGINRKGQVLNVTIDEDNIVNYLLRSPENSELAFKLASRAGLPGADNLYQQQFDQLCQSGNWAEAAKVAANSPRGFLRTPQTIERFKQAGTPVQGQLSIVLQYFGMLLDKGKLNGPESVELVRPVLQQNRKHLLEKWLNEEKLECTEELGDIARPFDVALALKVRAVILMPHVCSCTDT